MVAVLVLVGVAVTVVVVDRSIEESMGSFKIRVCDHKSCRKLTNSKVQLHFNSIFQPSFQWQVLFQGL